MDPLYKKELEALLAKVKEHEAQLVEMSTEINNALTATKFKDEQAEADAESVNYNMEEAVRLVNKLVVSIQGALDV